MENQTHQAGFRHVVVSLYDFTGVGVRPWAVAGYDCVCFDIQHSRVAPKREAFPSGGSITYINADLHNADTLSDIVTSYCDRAAFMMAYPVCTDLSVSGARHFAGKLEADPLFQIKAVSHAVWCGHVGDALGVPYFIENPRSVLSTMWRKPNHSFEPWHFGGYIADEDAEHPEWPEYIAPRDAYPKTTYLWTGGGFAMPGHRAVEVEPGWSRQQKMLGGKSQKTKNIRSATPRGFAIAVHHANAELALLGK